MPRILIAECMQEISSFNPLPSTLDDFRIRRGAQLLEQRGLNTAIGGALSVFDRRSDVTLLPTLSATAPSAGILSGESWKRLADTMIAGIAAEARTADAVFFSLHGAMGAEGELDPEGWLLVETRRLVGPDVPIVVSLDLHGIATARMLDAIDGFAIYYTYPHVDFADTGRRAATALLRILDGGLKPVTARVVIPALVRGDELVTKSGCYGDILGEASLLERQRTTLSAGVMIGNPFTDVPELCSQILVSVEHENTETAAAAIHLAETFWSQRHRMQGKLIPLDRAIALAKNAAGPVVFTDAADATSSGATGDSNVILKALIGSDYPGRVLVQIVDEAAAQAAAEAGIGAEVKLSLGGGRDPGRFTPFQITATVASLSSGQTRLETMCTPLDAGLTAVLVAGKVTIVVISKPCFLFDRAVYYANGLDPEEFDLTIVKSPHTEYRMYDAWVTKNFNIDAPGSTSADLKSLGYTVCARPMFPLDDDTAFSPRVTWHGRGTNG